MARFVLKATKQHARNLAFFATIYKTLLIVQRRMHGKERPLDSFLAGLVGGYMVFGENNNVNQQVITTEAFFFSFRAYLFFCTPRTYSSYNRRLYLIMDDTRT
jgi:hypothetical protein